MVHKNTLSSNEKVIKLFQGEFSFPHKYIKRVNTSQSENAIILYDFCDATVIEDENELQEKMDNPEEVQVVKVRAPTYFCQLLRHSFLLHVQHHHLKCPKSKP